jgi:hypothetical protein
LSFHCVMYYINVILISRIDVYITIDKAWVCVRVSQFTNDMLGVYFLLVLSKPINAIIPIWYLKTLLLIAMVGREWFSLLKCSKMSLPLRGKGMFILFLNVYLCIICIFNASMRYKLLLCFGPKYISKTK